MNMKIYLKLFLLTISLLAFSLNIAAQNDRKLLPVDEAEKDASFKIFREKLIAAVKKHDTRYVLSIVDPNIKNGFGGQDGIANFKKQWKIANPKSELWDELLYVLTHGGSFDKQGKNKTFIAPYIYSNFPENLDAFEYSVITAKDVNLRATPFLTAPVIASLTYDFVKVDFENSIKDKSDNEKYSWVKVETLNGKKGFVSANFVRSSIDYRAGFEKKRGQWKMIFFLAGD